MLRRTVAASDYDPNNLDIFQHLTNNSVAKYYEGPLKEGERLQQGQGQRRMPARQVRVCVSGILNSAAAASSRLAQPEHAPAVLCPSYPTRPLPDPRNNPAALARAPPFRKPPRR